ncbi:hypothetical protein C8J57DRAFT_1220534 [Mycena rebaudengoi]|nr:hypothetical protein C8J57DRAFT_1220534 [Mycena rebaudengoi]
MASMNTSYRKINLLTYNKAWQPRTPPDRFLEHTTHISSPAVADSSGVRAQCQFSVAKYNSTKISCSPPPCSSTAMPPKLSPIWAAFHRSENMPNGKHHWATHWQCINVERPMTEPDMGAQEGSGDDYEL